MVEELESHLLSFMAILNHLQHDVVRLPDVLHAFAYFMQLYKNREDNFSKNMVQRLESRWKQWEQLLLILSFFFHSKYRNSIFNSNAPSLNLSQIGLWVQYYYKEWFKTQPSVILAELSKFVNKEYPFDDDTASNFDNIQKYWKFMIGATKELNILALGKVFSIAQMRAKITYNRAVKIARELEERIRASTITYNTENHEFHSKHIPKSVETEVEVIINEDEETIVNYSEDNEDSLSTNTNVDDEWRSVLNNWSEDLIIENIETSNETFMNLNHPADDPVEKWYLTDLFIAEFPAPSAIGNLRSIYGISENSHNQ
ncbi:11347_t:CDS:2 [Acaulospora morrowiae]|uniref:11347_t:CDS:1 n=1 Tax=Acaulospora morrowiae TaxID=94023 RepID=A0A9N8YVZ3_9GLOM|nr:11347_t:CDS:2 [Acaulospora morrowiae]